MSAFLPANHRRKINGAEPGRACVHTITERSTTRKAPTPCSVDELELDGVARAKVVSVSVVGDSLVHDVVLPVAHAERERVRVAVQRKERVARAVPGGVRVRLPQGSVSGSSRSRRLREQAEESRDLPRHTRSARSCWDQRRCSRRRGPPRPHRRR